MSKKKKNQKAHLEMRDISMEFNGFRALNNLNFSVTQGELRCLIGPNGAGKTTALDLICGKIKPTTGSIVLDDISLEDKDEHEIARIGIGRKFQIPSVFHQLTVRENLYVAHSKQIGVFANLMKFGQGSEKDRLEEVAEIVGLQDQMDNKAGYLSHGQTQWLEIALVLTQSPDVILMDEPTAGMTKGETKKTADLFNRLKGEHTLIVVEHDMGFIKEIGDVISVMHQGTMLAEGTVKEIESHPDVKEAYLGSGGITGA